MKQVLLGLFAICIGCLLIFFRKAYARYVIREQNRIWGFKFGETQVKISEIVAILVGTGFIFWGIMVASGMGRLRW